MKRGVFRARLSRGWVLALVLSACDADDADGLSASINMQTQTPAAKPDQGQAKVTVVLNNAPVLEAMTSSTGRVSSHVPVMVAAYAGDPDDDALAFAWDCDCPGDFDRTDRSRVTFVPGKLATDVSCTFHLAVNDGHGGLTRGALVLSSKVPVINVAPQMGVAYQSADHVAPGADLMLHASALDPEGGPLVWTWKADEGSLLGQSDAGSESGVTWHAPDDEVGTFTITATAADPEGASASRAFVVIVAR